MRYAIDAPALGDKLDSIAARPGRHALEIDGQRGHPVEGERDMRARLGRKNGAGEGKRGKYRKIEARHVA